MNKAISNWYQIV